MHVFSIQYVQCIAYIEHIEYIEYIEFIEYILVVSSFSVNCPLMSADVCECHVR